MTPTPTVILLIALFWTLPATSAVLFYRRHGSSMENVKAVMRFHLNRFAKRAFSRPEPQLK